MTNIHSLARDRLRSLEGGVEDAYEAIRSHIDFYNRSLLPEYNAALAEAGLPPVEPIEPPAKVDFHSRRA